VRITEAAQRLGISPRMLRYRESLGLLPVVRESRPATRTSSSAHRDGTANRSSAVPGARPPGTPRRPTTAPGAPGHRQFGAADLDAVSLGLAIEQRYDISPAALAFGLRVLADPSARAQVAELGRRIGRIRPLPAMALDFEKERAQRLLQR
jgi:MerR family transcriptional regulator, copper efflux regulator